MRRLLFFCLPVLSSIIFSCGVDQLPTQKKQTPDQQVAFNIERLKKEALPGDLILRLGDDLISNQVRFMNEKDRSFSHAGLIVDRNGGKVVCDIYPHLSPADTIEYITIDSFVNPARNVEVALFRYRISQPEKDSMLAIIDQYKAKDVRFDMVYDLATDDKMYCSEMIAKALQQATGNKIVCKQIQTPQRMRPLLAGYFKKLGITSKTIAERKFISIDNLYLIPECDFVMRFPVKYFPGQ